MTHSDYIRKEKTAKTLISQMKYKDVIAFSQTKSAGKNCKGDTRVKGSECIDVTTGGDSENCNKESGQRDITKTVDNVNDTTKTVDNVIDTSKTVDNVKDPETIVTKQTQEAVELVECVNHRRDMEGAPSETTVKTPDFRIKVSPSVKTIVGRRRGRPTKTFLDSSLVYSPREDQEGHARMRNLAPGDYIIPDMDVLLRSNCVTFNI